MGVSKMQIKIVPTWICSVLASKRPNGLLIYYSNQMVAAFFVTLKAQRGCCQASSLELGLVLFRLIPEPSIWPVEMISKKPYRREKRPPKPLEHPLSSVTFQLWVWPTKPTPPLSYPANNERLRCAIIRLGGGWVEWHI